MLTKKTYFLISCCLLIISIQLRFMANANETRKAKTEFYQAVMDKFMMYVKEKIVRNIELTEKEIEFILFLSSIIRKSKYADLEANTENWFLRSG